MTGQEWSADPDLVLDEAFVAGARRVEATGQERAQRATRITRAHGSSQPWRSPGAAGSPDRAPARRAVPVGHRDRRGALALVAVLVLGCGAWTTGLLPSSTYGQGAAGAVLPGADSAASGEAPASEQRLLAPVSVPAAGGDSFTFLATNGDDRSPVGWDPCRPVRHVTRPAGQPPGAEALLAAAWADVSSATGLLVVDAGVSDEGPSDDRPAGQLREYGPGWAPVLVVWSDPAESPELAGDVAGYADPVGHGRSGERRWVSGQVVLDGPQLAELQARPGGENAVRVLVLHELAHLMGLGHVDDVGQVMHSGGGPAGPAAYADGDRHGLALLGSGGCR